jgi:hypothetical protein
MRARVGSCGWYDDERVHVYLAIMQCLQEISHRLALHPARVQGIYHTTLDHLKTENITVNISKEGEDHNHKTEENRRCKQRWL